MVSPVVNKVWTAQQVLKGADGFLTVWVQGKVKPPGIGPQVVLLAIYQGLYPFWVSIFDPHPLIPHATPLQTCRD